MSSSSSSSTTEETSLENNDFEKLSNIVKKSDPTILTPTEMEKFIDKIRLEAEKAAGEKYNGLEISIDEFEREPEKRQYQIPENSVIELQNILRDKFKYGIEDPVGGIKYYDYKSTDRVSFLKDSIFMFLNCCSVRRLENRYFFVTWGPTSKNRIKSFY